MNFKIASRSTDELKVAKQELDDLFAIVRGKNGRVDARALKEIDSQRIEIAEAVVQLINDEIAVSDPTPMLVDVIDGTLGNDYVWQEIDSALRVVSRSPGSIPLSQGLTFTEYGVTTSQKEIAVEIPLEKIAVGRVTASQVTTLVAEAVNRYRIASILSAVDAGVPSGADRSGVTGWNLRYSGLDHDNLDAAVDGMLDESESVTIFGRHAALAGIRTFDDWADLVQADMQTRGQVGRYRGQPVLTLRDTTSKRVSEHLISAKKVYLAAAVKGAKYVQKDLGFLNWAEVDAKSATFGMGLRMEDGLLVFDPYRYRIITIS